MEAAVNPDAKNSWLHKPVTSLFPGVTVEHLLVTLIILAAVITRFYAVGLRVMSHDEVNHVVPSYELYQGRGYAHDPVTHGPLQFHLLAASYFLMGDSDFASRVPVALFSIATVVFVLFAFRRYLDPVPVYYCSGAAFRDQRDCFHLHCPIAHFPRRVIPARCDP